MAKKTRRFLGGNNPRLDVNLKEVFGKSLPNDPSLQQSIGQALLDKILDRTDDGKFLKQSKGAGSYSDEYADTEEFRAFGKSKSDVNLKQTGDMMGQLGFQILSKNKIRFQWEDSLQAAKAHGHITGNVGKTRDFLGFTRDELDEVKRDFKRAIEDDNASAANPQIAALLNIIERVSGGSSS